ncbi:hypothetical protein BCT01_20080 [Vibrio tasmaniensis]|jgi:hypothetical protein|uniref:Uncharacterized protein n=1 Tax=Vibrio genomosp. F6 str. FF-238 TaxID=1191298 RepID=A0A1E5CMH9_9VIBR|nr:hypothetical protein [Vibrio genomosp. F6]OEE70810.1 hypothetical protein A130_08510 [Vibrio genomosp. F6 str. FF-238]OEF69922.1 hypothetical protein A162_21835 [Vibrio tasmaniensis 1F-155]PMO89461.1 hypothetical protein BCT01_20080 [Vibrio tasmaniensis]
MSEFKTIVECARPEFVSNLNVSRSQDQGILEVYIEIKTLSGHITVTLSGFDDLSEAISQILLSEHFVISEELHTGKEFGTVRIECWEDASYSEYWCDSATLCS